MSQKIYALQVGINAYPPQVPTLSGCLNDVDHVHDWLRSRLPGKALAVETLKDGDATRAHIIEGFRKHLGRAGAGDVALFHFCGHGAQWASAAAFRAHYPGGQDEGLVCVDSRLPGGYDLADKELAVLIDELARREAHVAVLLDCCHSGSGTRGVDAFRGLRPRLTHSVTQERPLDSYLDGHYARLQASGRTLFIPTARHILLAACERGQLAQESMDHAGVFTSTLVEVLEQSGGQLSYAELFVRCRAAVRSRADDQDPQFEAYHRFDAHGGFLGAAISRTRRRYSAWFDQGAWQLDGGALHGLPVDAEQPVAVALYRDRADGGDPEGAVGTATVVQIGPQRSELALDFAGAPDQRYQAELTSLPVPPLPVAFEGPAAARTVLAAALEAEAGVRVALVDAGANVAHGLRAEADRLVLTRATLPGQPAEEIAYAQAGGHPPDWAAALGALLPSLAAVQHWERSLALRNARTQMDPSLLDLVLAEPLPDGGEHAHAGTEAILDVTREGAAWRHARLRFKVRNRTAQTLHLVLAYFSNAYGIHILANEPLEPGGAWMTLWGDAPEQDFYLDDDVDEAIERFQLLVATEKIDDFLLVQDDLALGERVGVTRAVGSVRPARKVVHRNEWFTRACQVRVVRRLDQVAAADVRLAQGRITIKGHPKLTANLSLAAARTGTRGLGGAGGAADFYRAFDPDRMSLVNFGSTRGDDQSVLELTDIRHAESLKDTPLELVVNLPLAEDEGLLPLVYDGRHAYLGGQPSRQADGSTLVTIDGLPELADQRRSLGSALKLYFFKTWLKQERVNRLAWVDYRADGTLAQIASGVAGKVAQARRVLLLVHGIIGDTDGMAAGVQACGVAAHYDLVLSYDYENLATPIEETARRLRDDLAAVGLQAGDDKHLTLLVHSMGGLVSRWFIEQEGGRDCVDHLVMCGTPNQGSPFGRIEDARKILGMLTGLAVNYLPAFIPFTSAVLLLVNRSKKLTPTLEQMHPQSAFIQALNPGPDPGIPYTVLAGDVDAYREPSDALFAALVAKAGRSFAFDLLFAHQANDIAAGVPSILGVAGTRQPPPVQQHVACHHMNYFVSEAGQQALKTVAW